MIPVQKSFPPERLKNWPTNGWIKMKNYDDFRRWKLSQQRQSWWYAAIGLPALGLLVGLLVAGGCR
jgi:hypothetical protein